MTWAEAISVRERSFQLMKANGYDEEDYADKVLGILVTWGLPQEGDRYPGPMYAGEYITAADLDMLKSATLYQVVRQQDPDGKRIDPKPADIGRKVVYRDPGGLKVEEGVITSFNDTCVFVRYGADTGSNSTGGPGTAKRKKIVAVTTMARSISSS
jgi:hypothetical protein